MCIWNPLCASAVVLILEESEISFSLATSVVLIVTYIESMLYEMITLNLQTVKNWTGDLMKLRITSKLCCGLFGRKVGIVMYLLILVHYSELISKFHFPLLVLQNLICLWHKCINQSWKHIDFSFKKYDLLIMHWKVYLIYVDSSYKWKFSAALVNVRNGVIESQNI
jgi:hypothetical protein